MHGKTQRNEVHGMSFIETHECRFFLRDSGAAIMYRQHLFHRHIHTHERDEFLHGGGLCSARTALSGCFLAVLASLRAGNVLTWLCTQKLISKMDQLTNLPVFKSIQISLACQACIDAEKTHEWWVYVWRMVWFLLFSHG